MRTARSATSASPTRGAVVAQGRREAEDLLLVVAGQDQDGAVVVGLLDGDDLPESRRGAGGGDDEVLVEDDVVTRVEGGGHDGGPHAHPVAPPGDGDVGGARGGVHGQDGGVRQGRELEGLDVLVEGRQLLARCPEGVGQVCVLSAETPAFSLSSRRRSVVPAPASPPASNGSRETPDIVCAAGSLCSTGPSSMGVLLDCGPGPLRGPLDPYWYKRTNPRPFRNPDPCL